MDKAMMRTATEPALNMILVWDPLVRVFHWTLATCFIAAYLLTEGNGAIHQALGYLAGGLVALRIAWGFIGPSRARFADFVPSRRSLFVYVRDMSRGREQRYIGHNPAGGVMILALLAQIALLALIGWLMTTDAFWGVRWLQDLHEAIAHLAAICVCVHVGGAIVESIRHRENLPLAMITGRKRA
jgi:cytochrome b